MTTRYPVERVRSGPVTASWVEELAASIAEVNGGLGDENLSEQIGTSKLVAGAMHEYAEGGTSTPATHSLSSAGADWTTVSALSFTCKEGVADLRGAVVYEWNAGSGNILGRAALLLDDEVIAEEDGARMGSPAPVPARGAKFRTCRPVKAGTHTLAVALQSNVDVDVDVENTNLIAVVEYR